jgi:hypothetical protein
VSHNKECEPVWVSSEELGEPRLSRQSGFDSLI